MLTATLQRSVYDEQVGEIGGDGKRGGVNHNGEDEHRECLERPVEIQRKGPMRGDVLCKRKWAEIVCTEKEDLYTQLSKWEMQIL